MSTAQDFDPTYFYRQYNAAEKNVAFYYGIGITDDAKANQFNGFMYVTYIDAGVPVG
jgi:hypothetical protein